MSIAFAEVCDALSVAEGDQQQREKIALLILDIARSGEHDADQLRDRAMRAIP
jgi:hypothetical protein